MPAVLIDRARRTAIEVARGPKWSTLVVMGAGMLTTTRVPVAQMGNWHEATGYSVAHAAARYLQHKAGLSPAAEQALVQTLLTAWISGN